MAINRDVFLNVPFDRAYQPLFWAANFALLHCGYEPHCAQEVDDSGAVRFEKICRLIARCCLAIHDISRTSLDRDRYRFHIFVSDIAGQDIRAHKNRVSDLVDEVRAVIVFPL